MSFLPRLGRKRQEADGSAGGHGNGTADGTPEIPGALRRGGARNGHANGSNGATSPEGRNGHGGGLIDRTALKKQATDVPISALGWLDERSGVSPFLRATLFRKVPKGTNWFYTLGSATMFAFLSQAVTGVFLAMYYQPSAGEAYESVSHITNEVFLGELVRGMHRWGSTVMIVLIFLHMARTFFFGAYKYPRELNWVIGVVLLVLTLAMGFTGYLLPFDQRSYWATVVGVNINASGPIIGPYLADFLRAGPEFTQNTLPRFYSIHMLLLPGLIAALIGAHLYLVAKLGTTAPPWLKAEKRRELSRTSI
jgi:quinol-cytochrome oxidoreductase complex cytochrome b subunit